MYQSVPGYGLFKLLFGSLELGNVSVIIIIIIIIIIMSLFQEDYIFSLYN